MGRPLAAVGRRVPRRRLPLLLVAPLSHEVNFLLGGARRPPPERGLQPRGRAPAGGAHELDVAPLLSAARARSACRRSSSLVHASQHALPVLDPHQLVGKPGPLEWILNTPAPPPRAPRDQPAVPRQELRRRRSSSGTASSGRTPTRARRRSTASQAARELRPDVGAGALLGRARSDDARRRSGHRKASRLVRVTGVEARRLRRRGSARSRSREVRSPVSRAPRGLRRAQYVVVIVATFGLLTWHQGSRCWRWSSAASRSSARSSRSAHCSRAGAGPWARRLGRLALGGTAAVMPSRPADAGRTEKPVTVHTLESESAILPARGSLMITRTRSRRTRATARASRCRRRCTRST